MSYQMKQTQGHPALMQAGLCFQECVGCVLYRDVVYWTVRLVITSWAGYARRFRR